MYLAGLPRKLFFWMMALPWVLSLFLNNISTFYTANMSEQFV